MRTKIEEQIMYNALQGDPAVYHTHIYAELKLRIREDELPTIEGIIDRDIIEGIIDRAIEELKISLDQKIFYLNDGLKAYTRVWGRLIGDNHFSSKRQKIKSSEGFIEIYYKTTIDLEIIFPISMDDFELLTKGDREQKLFSGLDSLDSFFKANRISLKSCDEVLIEVFENIRGFRGY